MAAAAAAAEAEKQNTKSDRWVYRSGIRRLRETIETSERKQAQQNDKNNNYSAPFYGDGYDIVPTVEKKQRSNNDQPTPSSKPRPGADSSSQRTLAGGTPRGAVGRNPRRTVIVLP